MMLAIPDFLEPNALETARFGVVTARLTDPEVPLATVNAAAAEWGVRMITARVKAADLARAQAMEADGYRLMDTLVYYTRGLEDLPGANMLPRDAEIRHAVASDADAVADVARAAFRGYSGHYQADPRLDDMAADAAYVEWAKTSIARQTRAQPALVVLQKSRAVGFLTMRRNSAAEVEIILNAVHPVVQRSGLYSALIKRALGEGRAMGAERMIVSTQVTNAAVQRVWARRGFVFDRAFYTFHKWFD
jgi:ribosomal protein S18 acetylase RimI-like enzyme